MKQLRLALLSIAIGLCILSVPDSGRADDALLLSEPADGAQVLWRPQVAGTTTVSADAVWVVVRPLGTSGYWVQPPASVHDDGRWKTLIYIGRDGSIDVGKSFEIVAFANPKEALREGLQLSSWPEAEARSGLVEVTRK